MNRRKLLKRSLATCALVLSRLKATPALSILAKPDKPKFKTDLSGRRVGINANQEQLIELACANGFGAVEPLLGSIKTAGRAELDSLNAKRIKANLAWSAADLPVEFRRDETTFRKDLRLLGPVAKSLQTLGVTRIGTWIMPCHDFLTYRANFRLHATRLKEIALVLEQYELRLGLEYVGTKSLRNQKRFPFLHTMQETKELIAVVGQSNVGFVLDSWHWTMAGEKAEDILSLTNEQVVACDLNDAPKGIELDSQIDHQRELPMATGVLDTQSFLQALVDIKYDGPIRAEPFSSSLNELDDAPAARATANAMQKATATVGV